MIQKPKAWQTWEANWQRRTYADFETNRRIFEQLLQTARDLGVWPPENPLEGIEVDIRLAHAVNYGMLDEPAGDVGPGTR